MQRFLTSLLALTFRVLGLIPARLLGAIGAGLGRMAFYLDKRHRHTAFRNLSRVYPEKSRSWRWWTARESFAELGRTLFELPHVFTRSEKYLRSRITAKIDPAFHQAAEQKRGMFIAACHQSNWELGNVMISLQGYPSKVIYRIMKQASIDAFVKQCRERFGATLISRLEGIRWLPRSLRDGDTIIVMIDQHQSHGMPVPFLGHLASTTTLPTAFVYKQGTPVFGATIQRIGRSFRFSFCIQPIAAPVATGDKDADAYRLMQTINHHIEPSIHERPELWLWSHRRWRILEEQRDIAEAVHGTP